MPASTPDWMKTGLERESTTNLRTNGGQGWAASEQSTRAGDASAVCCCLVPVELLAATHVDLVVLSVDKGNFPGTLRLILP